MNREGSFKITCYNTCLRDVMWYLKYVLTAGRRDMVPGRYITIWEK